jgi:hypothetical protein
MGTRRLAIFEGTPPALWTMGGTCGTKMGKFSTKAGRYGAKTGHFRVDIRHFSTKGRRVSGIRTRLRPRFNVW